MLQLVLAYELADSLGAAEREARRWTRLAPESARAWSSLWDVLERQGKFAEAEQVAARAGQIDRDPVAATDRTAWHAIRLGNFELADRVLRAAIQTGSSAAQQDAYWDLVISLRYQGRATEAIDIARKYRALVDRNQHVKPGEATQSVRPLAQSLADAGRYREAAALFDSTANWKSPDEPESSQARERAWSLAHAARTLAAGGDTATLAVRADTIQAVAAMSGSERDRGLASYIRGLLLMARNDLPNAVDSIRKSIYSLPAGYTRENYDLAQALLRLDRPQEAIAVLQPIMRSKLDASNYYVTQTEVRELLAKAWTMAGRPDSAAVHYERVARAWEHGDPPYAKRAAEARAAIMAK
jgi:tetratricopeptide (TPR) repeat protein